MAGRAKMKKGRRREICAVAPGCAPESADGGKTRLASLGELKPGASGKIRQLSCRGKLRRRLMDLGVVAGTPFEIVRVAPLGDPVELKVKGIHLSLRREEAWDICVEVPEDGR